MKILLIGSGGREHALAISLFKSPRLSSLFIAPGNPGTAQLGTNVAIQDTDISGLLAFAVETQIDLTIVGPEAPLAAGISDLFIEAGLAIVGPTQIGAQLESSKAWSKAMMLKAGIPTASYGEFTDHVSAITFIEDAPLFPIVVKADGLAAGKGVTVATDKAMALNALNDCFVNDVFSGAGQKVIIESFLKGEEASIFAFCDGKSFKPMLAAQDHKAIFDGDKGPNTGGMGAYCPAPIVTPAIAKMVNEQVFEPLLAQFKAEGIHYCGIIYAGLMIDGNDVNVVEFNARFGDPETQIVLPHLKTDLIDVFEAMVQGRLSEIELEWLPGAAVCVVMASEGYPGSYAKGRVITGVDSVTGNPYVVHAGTKRDDNQLLTSGGRVLAVVGQGDDIASAIDSAYKGVDCISFEGAQFRRDIGAKASKWLNRSL
ncbi:MAG: phosphoribosylamine--glycine ligase [bacterium]|nr:phosphoribosylamine--glycine ligase [bacterium]